jgi:calcium binding protein 39
VCALYRAFHVFKVFVANPKKPVEISAILYKNKAKLIPFLEAFQSDKGDEQFNDEKKLLIEYVHPLCTTAFVYILYVCILYALFVSYV